MAAQLEELTRGVTAVVGERKAEEMLVKARAAACLLAVLKSQSMSQALKRRSTDEEEQAFVSLQMLQLKSLRDKSNHFTKVAAALQDFGMSHKPDFHAEPGCTPRENTDAAWRYLVTGERTGIILKHLGPAVGPPRAPGDVSIEEIKALTLGSGRVKEKEAGAFFDKHIAGQLPAGWYAAAVNFPLKSRVRLTGLVAKPELNGREGVVVSVETRVGVRLDGESKPIGLKPENLESLLDELPRKNAPAWRSGAPKPNEPCPCGSGKKYKKCCGAAGGT